MFDPQTLLAFAGAGLLLNITPGPDVLYIVGRSLSQGRLAGVISALGISAGCLLHVAAAALGLSTIDARGAACLRRRPLRRRGVSRVLGLRAHEPLGGLVVCLGYALAGRMADEAL